MTTMLSSPTLGKGPGTAVPTLSVQHIQYLEERGVSTDAAETAGLISVDAAKAGRLLGTARMAPSGGLAIPYPGVDPPYVRVRLDCGAPRFLAPAGRAVPLYIPAQFAPSLDDSIVVVEGPIKSLALAANGIHAVGLGGTGTTLEGSSRDLNESWSRVSLPGRRVVILFDSNRATNLSVARDETRLAVALKRAGALVMIGRIPLGTSVGPDDFLAQNGVQALVAVIAAAIPADPVEHVKSLLLATTNAKSTIDEIFNDLALFVAILTRGTSCQRGVGELLRPHKMLAEFEKALKDVGRDQKVADACGKQATKTATYEARDGALHVGINDVWTPLSNFDVKIVREMVHDDGLTQSRYFEIQGTTEAGDTLPVIELTPTEFSKSSWWLERYGACAIAASTPSLQDHLRTAVQVLSIPVPVVRSFAHTGWRRIGDTEVYLHAAGAIGGEAVDVSLQGQLARFALPVPPDDVSASVRAALRILDVAEPEVAVPVFLSAFRAPLMELLPVDGAVHLFGPTGTLKSSLAAVAQSFFGNFIHAALPASFTSTFTSLEAAIFTAKDALLVIDEFVPTSADSSDPTRRKAMDVFRLIGNRSPRGARRSRTRAFRASARPLRGDAGCDARRTGRAGPVRGAEASSATVRGRMKITFVWTNHENSRTFRQIGAEHER